MTLNKKTQVVEIRYKRLDQSSGINVKFVTETCQEGKRIQKSS